MTGSCGRGHSSISDQRPLIGTSALDNRRPSNMPGAGRLRGRETFSLAPDVGWTISRPSSAKVATTAQCSRYPARKQQIQPRTFSAKFGISDRNAHGRGSVNSRYTPGCIASRTQGRSIIHVGNGPPTSPWQERCASGAIDSFPMRQSRGKVSRSITARVRGRTPRHHENASAACSTSMPTPSAIPRTPASRASRRKGVRRFP